MKSVSETRYTTAYKKALNSIINFTGSLRVKGMLPSMITNNNTIKLFDVLNLNLSTKRYVLTNEDEDSLNGEK